MEKQSLRSSKSHTFLKNLEKGEHIFVPRKVEDFKRASQADIEEHSDFYKQGTEEQQEGFKPTLDNKDWRATLVVIRD